MKKCRSIVSTLIVKPYLLEYIQIFNVIECLDPSPMGKI